MSIGGESAQQQAQSLAVKRSVAYARWSTVDSSWLHEASETCGMLISASALAVMSAADAMVDDATAVKRGEAEVIQGSAMRRQA